MYVLLYRQTGRQTVRHTDRHTDSQIDTQTDRFVRLPEASPSELLLQNLFS